MKHEETNFLKTFWILAKLKVCLVIYRAYRYISETFEKSNDTVYGV